MGPLHAYALAARLAQMTADAPLMLNQGTLYPALVRLEQKGWIKGRWSTTEHNREAKFYAITTAGTRALGGQTARWRRSGRPGRAAAHRRALIGGRMRRLWLRLWTFLRRDRAERELTRELAAHLQLVEDDFLRRGMARDDAAAAAAPRPGRSRPDARDPPRRPLNRLARRSAARRRPQPAGVQARADVHRRGGGHAGAWHRRHDCDLQRRERAAAEAAPATPMAPLRWCASSPTRRSPPRGPLSAPAWRRRVHRRGARDVEGTHASARRRGHGGIQRHEPARRRGRRPRHRRRAHLADALRVLDATPLLGPGSLDRRQAAARARDGPR